MMSLCCLSGLCVLGANVCSASKVVPDGMLDRIVVLFFPRLNEQRKLASLGSTGHVMVLL